MARGLSREQSRAKNVAKTSGKGTKNEDGLTPAQRNERDAVNMAEKKALKEKAKTEGQVSTDDVEAEAKRKAKVKAEQKARQELKAGQCIPKSQR